MFCASAAEVKRKQRLPVVSQSRAEQSRDRYKLVTADGARSVGDGNLERGDAVGAFITVITVR